MSTDAQPLLANYSSLSNASFPASSRLSRSPTCSFAMDESSLFHPPGVSPSSTSNASTTASTPYSSGLEDTSGLGGSLDGAPSLTDTQSFARPPYYFPTLAEGDWSQAGNVYTEDSPPHRSLYELYASQNPSMFDNSCAGPYRNPNEVFLSAPEEPLNLSPDYPIFRQGPRFGQLLYVPSPCHRYTLDSWNLANTSDTGSATGATGSWAGTATASSPFDNWQPASLASSPESLTHGYDTSTSNSTEPQRYGPLQFLGPLQSTLSSPYPDGSFSDNNRPHTLYSNQGVWSSNVTYQAPSNMALITGTEYTIEPCALLQGSASRDMASSNPKVASSIDTTMLPLKPPMTTSIVTRGKPSVAPLSREMPSPLVQRSQTSSKSRSRPGHGVLKTKKPGRSSSATASDTIGGRVLIVPGEDASIEERDEFLVQAKNSGMAYKDIKLAGRFREAVSTLRGRFRTLTKTKKDRVRHPQWSQFDIVLLQKAVAIFAPKVFSSKLGNASDGKTDHKAASGKVPWTKVAKYIASHGSSYSFGNATCRKKWDEINE